MSMINIQREIENIAYHTAILVMAGWKRVKSRRDPKSMAWVKDGFEVRYPGTSSLVTGGDPVPGYSVDEFELQFAVFIEQTGCKILIKKDS